MCLFTRIAVGVVVACVYLSPTVVASDLRPVRLDKRAAINRPSALLSDYTALAPVDLCIFGGRNVCSPRVIDGGSITPAIEEPILVRPVRIQPVPPARKPPKTTFFLLSTAVYTAAWIDMHRTYPQRHVIAEQDPFVRPLLKLPAPAYYTTCFALATAINYLGWRMSRSRRFRKIWFLPQALTISGNIYGRASTI